MAQHPQFPQQTQFPPFNLPDLSPGSPDSITMHGFGRPTDTNMLPYAQYEASMSSLLASAHGPHAFAQNQGLNPIIRFMHDPEAWNSVKVTAASQSVGVPFNPSLPSFTDFRTVPASEPDTVNQSLGGDPTDRDSGYGSNARQSVGNPSVHGEVDPSVISRLQAMVPGDTLSKEEAHRQEARGQRSTTGNPNAKSLVCPGCKKPVKTPSELKKHEARHSKPFKCHFLDCPKSDGFATKNDLDRHNKSVHKIVTGDESVYRCDIGSCRDKPKDWPRPDNFRQHLKRRHGLEKIDLARFTFRIPGTSIPDVVPAEAATSESPIAASSMSASQTSWEGMDHGHVAPASLINGHARVAQMGNMMPYSGLSSMDERGMTSLGTDRSQYPGRNPAESAHLRVMVPSPSVLSMQRPSPQIASSDTGTDQPTYVAPNVLNQACAQARRFDLIGTEVQQPTEAARREADDTLDDPQQDVRSEADEVESSSVDDMDLDVSAQDSASEDGMHDSDSEEDQPSDNSADVQSNLLRNAGAQYLKLDEVHIKASPSQEQSGVETPRPIDLDDETQASAVIKSLMRKGKLEEMLKKLGYTAPDDAETKDQKLAAVTSTPSDSGHINKCNECNKFFQRRCELKKHLKRHAKPYACTFVNCVKKFGSKNDWKRHENSQHFQLEIWRCAEKAVNRPDQTECGKVFHRRESLKAHFERDHDIHDLAALDGKLSDCRMGRNFESRFWCGFCQKTIEPTGNGRPAHSERFNHIDDHFNGRDGMTKVDIKNWKHVDTDALEAPANSPGKARRPKGPPTARAGKSGKSNKRGYGGDGEDGASRAKRFKDGNGKAWFWTCCSCGNYWSVGTTLRCVLDRCEHEFCDGCKVEMHSEAEVPPPVQNVENDGMMT